MMDDLQLNISVSKKNKKKVVSTQTNIVTEYKFLAKPNFTGKAIARKRSKNLPQVYKQVSQTNAEPAQKVSKPSDSSKPKDVESNLRDLSENKGKFKGKDYQELNDEIQTKQKPRSGAWISSLFKNNPDVPRIGQRAVRPIVEKVFAGKTFSELDLHPHSVANLEQNLGLKELMTVQQSAIPVILQGRDVLIRSQTGSGKTLAYALPIIEGLQAIRPKINRFDGIRAVVVVPTRELAVQTYELFVKLVKPFTWIVPGLLSGGQKRKAEKARLRKGLSVLVGTPGRVNDHLKHTKSLNFAKTACLILDEADRLLDMGYEKDVAAIVQAIEDHKKAATYDPLKIIKQTFHKNISSENSTEIFEKATDGQKTDVKHHLTEIFISQEKQTILLSATLTKAVENLAGITLVDPVFVDTSEGRATIADSLKPKENNKQHIIQKDNTKFEKNDKTVEKKETNAKAPEDIKNQDSSNTEIKNSTKLDLKPFNGSLYPELFEIDSNQKTNQTNLHNDSNIAKKTNDDESDSDSDYEYFKVQKELEAKNIVVESIEEVKPSIKGSVNTFKEAVKSAIAEDELVLPATVNQTFLVVPMKLRLVTLCSLIVEHCVVNKKGGKMIIFMATLEMVDYHAKLIETVLTGKEIKVKKKTEDALKKSKVKKRKANENDEAEESRSDSEFEVDYEAPAEGGLVPLTLDMFSLHGSMPHEQRMEVFKQFRAARVGVLICTDVAARGIDVQRVDLVLQYCAPASATDYVHRVGRTGRAAHVGAAVMLLLPSETEYVRYLEEKRIRLRQTNESQCLEALRTLCPSAASAARAAIALQARLENVAHSAASWRDAACRAYTSWVRFYAGYPREVRQWLDAKQLHLGHAAKAFALRDTPAMLARRAKSLTGVKGERPSNRLTVHEEEDKKRPGFPKVKKIGSLGNRVMNKQSSMHTASEFDSGLPPMDHSSRKKMKKNK